MRHCSTTIRYSLSNILDEYLIQLIILENWQSKDPERDYEIQLFIGDGKDSCHMIEIYAKKDREGDCRNGN